MKKICLILAAAAVCFYIPSAHAQTKVGDFEVTGNVGFTTDYVWRGISQTDENPAVQGGFDISHTSGLYAGVWGSNVDFNDGDEASVEVDLYGGYAGEYNNFSYDVGVLYYAYPGADSDLDYDFVEFAFSVGYDFEVAALTTSINYSPDFFGSTGDAVYYAAGLDIPLPADFTLAAHVGHQTFDEGEDYTDWSLGLAYTLYGFDLALTYYDTDLDEPEECADGCSERVVASVTKTF